MCTHRMENDNYIQARIQVQKMAKNLVRQNYWSYKNFIKEENEGVNYI